METLEDRINTIAILAIKNDQRIDESQAQTAVLQQVARRIDTVLHSHSKQLVGLAQTTARIEQKLTDHDERFDRIEVKFAIIDARFDAVDARFDRLESRFDRLESRFDRLESRFDRLESRFSQLGEKFDELLTVLRK